MRSLPIVTLSSLLFFSTSVIATRAIQESPVCAKECGTKPELSQIPLCAINPVAEGQTASVADIKNMFSCLCTDKKMLEINVPCILKACADDSIAIGTWFTQTYTECNTLGGVQYPSPPEFLKALNITVPANVSIPSTISGVPQATVFPSVVATTKPSAAIPTDFFNGRFSVADAAAGADEGPGNTNTTHINKSDGAAVGVSGVVLGVVLLAVFL